MTDYTPYIQAWRERWRKQKVQEKQLAEEAKQRAAECARVLIEEFGARRVFLIGSLAEGYFHAGSDIDLTVEGLEPSAYFRALSRMHRISKRFSVDLIPFEEYEYQKEVLKRGIVLYEAPKR
jgi:predicted nucleotidyltransferase